MKGSVKKAKSIRFDVVTLFPETIEAYTNASILGRAQKAKLLQVRAHQMRDYSKHKWNQVDFRPYGGGPGMVIEAPAVIRAVESIIKKANPKKTRTKASTRSTMIYHSTSSEVNKATRVKVLLTSAGGKPLTNTYAKQLVQKYDQVIIICGRYEGVDVRVAKILKAEEVSVGPYVLTGGEVPALAIIDAASRHIPGVLGKIESLEEGRVASHDVYTRPEILEHKGKKHRVPKVLLSGNHKDIDAYREKRRSGR
jgi:tRNA (guanine37-N1)-methyltransferase